MPEFKNPSLDSQGPAGGGPGGGDFRSMLLMLTVVLAIFFAFQYFKPAQPAPPSPQPQKQQHHTQPATSNAPAASAGSTAVAQGIPDTTAVTASSETETTVENELYRIVFTNRGAQVKHWILKKFNDATGKPLDLVHPQLAEQFGLPLSLFTYDSDLTAQINQALYQASSTGSLLAPGTLTFHYAQGGLEVVKTFRFDSSYVIGIETSVKRNGSTVRALVDWPAGLGDMDTAQSRSGAGFSSVGVRTPSQYTYSVNGKDESIAASKVSGNSTTDQAYDFAAISDLYFAAAFLPDSPDHTTVLTQHNTIDLPTNAADPNSQKKPYDVLGVAIGDTSGAPHLRLYAGPKQTDVLKSVHAMGADGKPSGPTLEPLIQYGWFGIIAKPLYLALLWLHNVLGSGPYSWGWAIIIFTVVFNLIFLPMRITMTKSSLKMARIQHKVDALKRKYAHLKINDPKRSEMNTEMMALYKEENINPYGSCLPLLLQMPLFFAYYRVLYNAVELRQAHWFWLTDLSTPDPLHILPVCIIITMFVVQYISPAMGMDRSQQRMMAFVMPLFMGFLLWSYASGLALYWITGNIINLGIQFGINQSHMGKELHAIAERRAQKKSKAAGPRVIEGRR